jgi:predicted amidophosphoribosyltransferase
VDDVCTTGATLGGLTTALAARGVVPTVGVVVAGA